MYGVGFEVAGTVEAGDVADGNAKTADDLRQTTILGICTA
jgi:hypothetical protein